MAEDKVNRSAVELELVLSLLLSMDEDQMLAFLPRSFNILWKRQRRICEEIITAILEATQLAANARTGK